jgi:response regulator RpfG family c-di-GMP phosphodiesterase
MAIFKKELLAQIERDAAPAGPQHTVMIVDDKDANVSVMAAVLRPHFHLIEARDGHEALSLIQALEAPGELACVISDHRMPKMTGVELFERIAPLLPQTRRILVTGFMDMDALADAINKAAVYKFVAKPFDAADFLLNVRCAVAAFNAERSLADYHRELEQLNPAGTARSAELQAQAATAQAVLDQAGVELQALRGAA